MLKKFIIKVIPNWALQKYRESDAYQSKLLKEWQTSQSNHYKKEESILELQKKFNYSYFLETGTLHGEMVYKLYDHFANLITIELSENLYLAAKKRLRNHKKIQFFNGDSGKVLPQIITEISSPCIFWLDAHFSEGNTAKGDKDTPVEEEINCVLSQPLNHIILIDDARCFGDKNYPDYPSLEKMEKLIKSKKTDYKFEVVGDIIRAYKGN